MMQNEKRGELPNFTEWKPWAGEVAAGYFCHEDLKQVRRDFFSKDTNPKVSLRSMAEYSQLTVTCVDAGKCVIRDEPEDAADIQEWLNNLQIEIDYRSQCLAS